MNFLLQLKQIFNTVLFLSFDTWHTLDEKSHKSIMVRERNQQNIFVKM